MTLPVSSYQELLSQVRNINQETQKLHLQLNTPFLECNEVDRLAMGSSQILSPSLAFNSGSTTISLLTSQTDLFNSSNIFTDCTMDVMNESNECNEVLSKILGWVNKEQASSPEVKEKDEHRNSSEVILGEDIPSSKQSFNYNMWHSVGPVPSSTHKLLDDTLDKRSHSLQQLGAKFEMVYNLLSMLGSHDREEMTQTLLVMSSTPDSCIAMRKSGCLPLLVQLLHGGEGSPTVRQGAAQALRNIVHCHADDKQGRREARVLRLLEQIRDHYEKLSANRQIDQEPQEENSVGQAIAALMKLSFDEEHRHAMCQLGALQTISTLIQADHKVHGCNTTNQHSITLRRYAGMTLTNLTFGDGANKSLLCSMPSFLNALVSQLDSPSEDLRQVTASVLRNLSWRADETSKDALREVNAITSLVKAAMKAEKESTLKSILSALWNFSAHSKANKVDICNVEGALEYLVKMLSYQAPSKTLSIIENAGGILRNVSCHIAVREDYRAILRDNNCLSVLLQQLRSPSLTVVSNACGTLWNISAHSDKDQRILWDLGAVPLLRSLVHSKHKMISVGSSATLKNLLAVRPEWDPFNKANKGMPTLSIRKRKALEQELDSNLAETCDNIEADENWDKNTDNSKIVPTVPQLQYTETNHNEPTIYNLRPNQVLASDTIDKKDKVQASFTQDTSTTSSASSKTDARFHSIDSNIDLKDEDIKVVCNVSLSTSIQSTASSNPSEILSPQDAKNDQTSILGTPSMLSETSPVDLRSNNPDIPLASCSAVFNNISCGTGVSISPNDLPDSPVETILSTNQFSTRTNETLDSKESNEKAFQDFPKVSNVESLPVQLSEAASLNSVNIEDPNKTNQNSSNSTESHEKDRVSLVKTDAQFSNESDNINLSRENLVTNNQVKTMLVKPCQRTVAKLSGVPVRTSPLRKPSNLNNLSTYDNTQNASSQANASHSVSCSNSSLLGELSDDCSESDNILAECIQSGMPQDRVESLPGSMESSPEHTSSVSNTDYKSALTSRASNTCFNSTSSRSAPLPRAIVHPQECREIIPQDEVKCFATEGSPCNFSLWSSTSDLTNSQKPEQLILPSPIRNNESTTVDYSQSYVEDEMLTIVSKELGECQMKESCGGTWNEDSTSLPSFTSPLLNKYHEDRENAINKPPVATITPFIEDESFNDSNSLSDSRIIELEAGKITIISSLDMEYSMSSVDLESVKPPSIMSNSFSLTSSLTDNDKSLSKSSKIRNILVRRALGDSVSCNIESMKPPSFLEEANMVDLENSILSVASIVSEVVDSPPASITDDITVTDSCSNDMTDSLTNGRITPKQKRTNGKERYNTYTIEADYNREESQEAEPAESDEVMTSEIPVKKITPKQRRQADKERFLTRTLGDGDFIDNKNETPHVIGNVDGKLSPKQKRSMNKDRYRTRTLSRENSLGSDTLVPIDNDILDPDTVTYISDYESEEEVNVVPKPKIVKPVKTPEAKSPKIKSGIPTFVNKTTPKVQPKKDQTTPKNRPTKLTQPLQRQGTFTKEKPTTPVSGIPVLSPKTGAPTSKKIPTKIGSYRASN